MIYRWMQLVGCCWLAALGSTVWAQPAQVDPETEKQLATLFADYHEQYLTLFPLEATAFGDMRYNDQLPIEISPDFIAKERDFYQRVLARLDKINRNRASDSLHLAADILEYELNMRLEGMDYKTERIPWNQFDGLPLSFGQFGSGQGNQPFKSVKDYDNWLKRIDGFAVWMQVAIEQFRQGIQDEYVLPKILIERMIVQCEDQSIVTEKPEDSLFYEPIKRLPDTFSQADQERLTAAYRDAVKDKVIPAYKAMGKFLREEYLPKGRATSGISAVQGGAEQYNYAVRFWTTTTLTPDEIFETGHREVARIRGEMERAQAKLGFQGTLKEFFQHLRTDKSFTPYENAEQILSAYRAIQTKLEPNVDKIFRGRPKTPFEIRRTEAFREKTASAEYNPGSADGSRPGIFYVPIPEPKSFNVTSGMESLFLHEAIPGHHYQISLQQENQQIPTFARFVWYGAYGEGWALYCESLGPELGLYDDPRQLMGALGDEMHRAIRLVVDVGMHAKGWTREQALEYMMANEPIAEDGAVAEIERYMAWPGQALSYKIGALKIRELRTKYEKELGAKFNLADFHHQVLKDGCMPLSILEKQLAKWAATVK